MSQQASSSSPFISRYTYDVFLSFHGEDTRFGFTGNLYSALSQRGIFTFIDDDALPKGEDIAYSLCKAIQESRISIIIFSKNYAFSTYCLNELVQINQCHKNKQMEILPVFYDIDPSHVRHQTGSYQEAFAKHEGGRFKDDIDMLQRWRLALRQAADLSGWDFKNGKEYEFSFIKRITEKVCSKLNRRSLHIANYPVGLKARMEQIQRLMGADEFDNKVTMLGIYGTGGTGKSTLARAMYNLMADQFEGSYFIANVREKSIKQGVVHIQETMLSELVGQRNINLGDVYGGISKLQERLCWKKVLLVLDDVDRTEQLQATAGGLDWFGPGSIIIITTRNKNLLNIHGVEKQYKVDEFNHIEALELFRWHAFKNKEFDPNYMEIIMRAIFYASGLPLALETIGSNLWGKTLDEWESALEAYERIPNKDVLEILRVSYDDLEDNQKEIFLDIACFFRGRPLRYVTNMLEARRGFDPKFAIRVLEEKSLINIDRHYSQLVTMHDLIQSMGKEIVRQQSPLPWKRNRLWFYEDIVCVLEKNKENDKIQAITLLDMSEDQKVQWNRKGFRNLKSLRMMLINKNSSFLRSPTDLPNSLRVLEWWEYPRGSLPSNFQSTNLVRLDLSYSYFQWDESFQNSKVLRHLILRGCKNIRRIPDMSGFPNLKELCLCKCTNLVEIHDSVGSLHNLRWFCAGGCPKLMMIPRGIKLTSLEFLSLEDCSSLAMFPEILEPMQNLKCVDLGGTYIKNLPHSMQNAEGLEILSMERCQMLESNLFQKLPEFFPNLTKLYLQGSNLTILPSCIEFCHSLKVLFVLNSNLEEISGLPPNIIRFSAANTAVDANCLTLNKLIRRAFDSTPEIMYLLPSQQIPEWFDHSTRGNSLCFWFRNELPSLTLGFVFGLRDNIKLPFIANFNLFVRINDIDLLCFSFPVEYETCISEDDHIIMLNGQNPSPYSMNSDLKRALKTNEWIHGNVSLWLALEEEDSPSWGVIKWTGVYVERAFSRMEDVQFTHPHAPNHVNQLLLFCEECASDIEQQQSLGLVNPTIPLSSEIGEQPLNYEYNNSDSQEPACSIDFSNDQDGAFPDHQAMAPSFAEMENVNAQGEMGTLTSQVSSEFTHQINKDYIEASVKIESTASESHKVDEVKGGLETKKNQFSNTMTLENELHQRLTRINKMKEDLGEQLSAIKAKISAIEANNSAIKANYLFH